MRQTLYDGNGMPGLLNHRLVTPSFDLERGVGLLVIFFAAWTVSYHLSLLLSSPASAIFSVLFLVCLLFLAVVLTLFSDSRDGGARFTGRESGAVLSLGVIVGSLLMFLNRPDADDIQLFYRALYQLLHIEQPFFREVMVIEPRFLPNSSVGFIPAYEFFISLSAAYLGLDPLWAYHNLVPLFLSPVLLAIYACLYRRLGFSGSASICGALGVFLFFVMDGNVHRSFGNMSLARLWQGKVIMWTLLVPLSLLITYRFMTKPTAYLWFLSLCVGISAAGLSATGLFMLPASVFGASAAFALAKGVSKQTLRSALLINLSSGYALSILALMLFGVLPLLNLSEVFQTWPQSWLGNLSLVVDSVPTLVRNIALLVLAPLVFLKREQRSFLIAYSTLILLLFLSPPSSEILLPMLQPGAYWRLIYLLPIPLGFGLLTAGFFDFKGLRDFKGLEQIAILLILLSSIVAYDQSSLLPIGMNKDLFFKSASDYRLQPAEAAFSEMISKEVTDRIVLAPESVSVVLPLINPTVQLYAARSFQTVHTFRRAGMPLEGVERTSAQIAVTICRQDDKLEERLQRAESVGVNAVIIAIQEGLESCKEQTNLVAQILGGGWRALDRGTHYLLFLKD